MNDDTITRIISKIYDLTYYFQKYFTKDNEKKYFSNY